MKRRIRIRSRKVYRAMQYIFSVIAAYGTYLLLWHKGIAAKLMESPEMIANLLWLTAMGCVLIGVYGVRRYIELERKCRRRETMRKIRKIKSAQERQLQKGA